MIFSLLVVVTSVDSITSPTVAAPRSSFSKYLVDSVPSSFFVTTAKIERFARPSLMSFTAPVESTYLSGVLSGSPKISTSLFSKMIISFFVLLFSPSLKLKYFSHFLPVSSVYTALK